MKGAPGEILRQGCEILDPLMRAHGVAFGKTCSGRGSGGPFARGSYLNGDRELELHFRFSLGLVTYHFRDIQIGHESLMRLVAENCRVSKYPGFSEDPLDAFRGLAYDLENFGSAFLLGDFETFSRCVTAATKQRSGFARIP